MADGTHISWTDATWNPITGCEIHSPACADCYAMVLAGTRLRNHPSRAGLTTMTKTGPVWNGEVRFNEQWLDQPRRWRRPRDIFVVAHGDLFYQRVPIEWQRRVINVMRECSWHRFQVLTKRPGKMLEVLQDYAPMPHILVGVSAERQQEADQRRPPLAELALAGWRTWVSYEPALGPVDWTGWEFIEWLVSGGESDTDGKSARPSHPDWHRAARDFCLPRDIAFHFKQWGAFAPVGISLASFQHPEPRRVGELVVELDGKLTGCPTSDPLTVMRRVGKKAAGATLDGREWRQMPEPTPPDVD